MRTPWQGWRLGLLLGLLLLSACGGRQGKDARGAGTAADGNLPLSAASSQPLPGASTLGYVNGDGLPELTALPDLPASVKAGGLLHLDLPVDADTGYVEVWVSSPAGTIAGNAKTVTFSGAAHTVSLDVRIDANASGTGHTVEYLLAPGAKSPSYTAYGRFVAESTVNYGVDRHCTFTSGCQAPQATAIPLANLLIGEAKPTQAHYKTLNQVPELTAFPPDPTPVAPGGTFTLAVPVDADTGFVRVMVVDAQGNMVGLGTGLVSVPSAQTVNVMVTLGANLPVGQYGLWYSLATSASSPTQTLYHQRASQSTYVMGQECALDGGYCQSTKVTQGPLGHVRVALGQTTGGGADGFAELAGAPMPPQSADFNGGFSVVVPVDADTGYVEVGLVTPTGNLVGSGATFVTPGATQAVSVLVSPFSAHLTGSYLLEYRLGVSSDAATFTYYIPVFQQAYYSVLYHCPPDGNTCSQAAQTRIPLATMEISTGGGLSSTYLDEGTAGQPVAVHTPYTGRVGAMGQSFYATAGLVPGMSYAVSLVNLSADVDLAVYGDADFGTLECVAADSGGGAVDESCVALANTQGALFIKTSTLANRGASFSLTLAPLGQALGDQGFSTQPLMVTVPYAGAVGRGSSHYRVGGLVPGSQHVVALTQLTDKVDLLLRDVQGQLLGTSRLSGIRSEATQVTVPPNGTLDVEVASQAARGASFTLSVW